MKQTVWLIRHPPVALGWQKRCYGQSDPALSREGQRMAKDLIAQITAWAPDLVIHSDLRRTRAIAERTAAAITAVPQWRERHFGDWEGQSWNAVYRASGNAMDGMLTAPDTYRPGGGETTVELFERIRQAWLAVPALSRVAIVTHGGPIACIRALQQNASIDMLPQLIPGTGEIVETEIYRQSDRVNVSGS